MANIKTHKASGWTREPIPDGSGCYLITPTDDSGVRKVRFLSAHSWANDPNDDRAKQETDRAVLVEGNPLPEWARVWLDGASARQASNGRRALQAAIDDADWRESMRDGW